MLGLYFQIPEHLCLSLMRMIIQSLLNSFYNNPATDDKPAGKILPVYHFAVINILSEQ